MTERMPALELAPSPCPQCGAVTFAEAETKCTATQQMSGDYECPGTDCPDDAPGGLMMFPTEESLARLNAWYDALADAADCLSPQAQRKEG